MPTLDFARIPRARVFDYRREEVAHTPHHSRYIENFQVMHGVLAYSKLYFTYSKELKRTALHVLGCDWLMFAQLTMDLERRGHTKGEKKQRRLRNLRKRHANRRIGKCKVV